ncbi:hypothetical protein HYFRA_00008736 [Hymenoscyphus fraxineus]|uniref:Amino acid transporter n=1 Tax=Hymenoscyphus fraxineus TaxID=746836 RepID=A0A9N9KXS0_9HELO|nr:hypothetical protein HYFRA_00008736 [Hymenoscyphus fraxineus]
MAEMKTDQSMSIGMLTITDIEHSRNLRKTNDDMALQRVGKTPVLKRKFGFMAILGFCCLVLSTWLGPFITLGIGLTNGGPAGLVYSFIIVWIGNLLTFACLAELASMAPTAGGQYHWVSILAPKSIFKGYSYVTGWITVTGWLTGVASSAYVTGTLIQGFIEVVNPSYSPQLWHASLLMYATLAFAVFCTTTIGTFLPKMEIGLLVLYIIGFFAVLVPLVYLGPHGDAYSVFGTFANNGGWSSLGLSFFVGISGNAFTFLGADAIYHMSEEVHDAAVVVPKSMIWCIIVNGVVGLSSYLAILFCAGDLQAALESRFIYAFIEILEQALHSTAGTAIILVIFILVDVGLVVGVMATCSRMVWSFARDRGVPGWRRLSKVIANESDHRRLLLTLTKVNSITAIPTASILVSAIISVLIGLITIGSSVGFNAVISLTVSSLYGSYFMACVLLLYRRLQGSIIAPSDSQFDGQDNLPGSAGKLVWGPWRIPEPLGTIINAVACIYLVVVFIFSLFPPATPVTAVTMNYSVVVLGGVAVLSGVYYVFWAHKTFKGPVIEASFH